MEREQQRREQTDQKINSAGHEFKILKRNPRITTFIKIDPDWLSPEHDPTETAATTGSRFL